MDDIINLKPFNTYFLDALEFYAKKERKKVCDSLSRKEKELSSDSPKRAYRRYYGLNLL